jgi:hypothetical protein
MADQQIPCPFGDAECEALNRVLARTPGLLKLCDDAGNCGWDTSATKESLLEQQAIAAKAKATFFPNRP